MTDPATELTEIAKRMPHSSEKVLRKDAYRLLGLVEALMAAAVELRQGDGVYYVTQERAFAPGIADGWPDVIPAPHTANGRLVKRQFLGGTIVSAS